jgi:hypothetical protein
MAQIVPAIGHCHIIQLIAFVLSSQVDVPANAADCKQMPAPS